MRWRDLALAIGCLLLGSVLGAILGAGTAQPWFGRSLAGLGVAGVVFVVAYIAIGSREEAFHRSAAVDVVFEGAGSPSVERFHTGHTFVGQSDTSYITDSASTTASAVSTAGWHRPSPPPDAMVVRLHVLNRRTRPLRQVRVRLRSVQSLTGERVSTYADWLKWMHDDGQVHPVSVTDGKEIRPGVDPDSYVDLATKRLGSKAFHLDYAMKHLRDQMLPAEPCVIHIEVTARDDESGRSAPMCRTAFRIGFDTDGGLTVETDN